MNRHYFKNNFGDRGLAFVVWFDRYGGAESDKYNTVEDLLNDCARDYIPSVQRDYRREVKMLLAAYIREIYKESDKIYDATGGDGRKYASAHYDNFGRLQAIRDIAKALGMDDAETIGSHAYYYYDHSNTQGLPYYYSEDVDELKWVSKRLGNELYSFPFKEEK